MCQRCATHAMTLLAVAFATAQHQPHAEVTEEQATLYPHLELAMRAFKTAVESPDEDNEAAGKVLIEALRAIPTADLYEVGKTLHFMEQVVGRLERVAYAAVCMRAKEGDETAKALVEGDDASDDASTPGDGPMPRVEVHVIDMDAIMRRKREQQEPQVPGRGKQPPMQS